MDQDRPGQTSQAEGGLVVRGPFLILRVLSEETQHVVARRCVDDSDIVPHTIQSAGLVGHFDVPPFRPRQETGDLIEVALAREDVDHST